MRVGKSSCMALFQLHHLSFGFCKRGLSSVSAGNYNDRTDYGRPRLLRPNPLRLRRTRRRRRLLVPFRSLPSIPNPMPVPDRVEKVK